MSGTPRAHAIDRWIFVFMAAWFIVIVLVGFIPDAMMKVGLVEAGQRPPFPLVLHMHAVAMGSFLLLLLAQTVMVATGRNELHKQVGIAAFVLVPVLVVVGLVLAPTMYYQTWGALQNARAPQREQLTQVLLDPGEHPVAADQRRDAVRDFHHDRADRSSGQFGVAQADDVPGDRGAAGRVDRPDVVAPDEPAGEPVGDGLVDPAALSPMFIWDVVRNRTVHEAYRIWLAIYVPVVLLVDVLWDKPAWHATARAIMRV